MATDVNTRLQNISTDVSAISNLVNRLVTIYSAGGVQNPDLAALKAELQAWTDTKLSGYALLASANTFTDVNTFGSNISEPVIIKGKLRLDTSGLNNIPAQLFLQSGNFDVSVIGAGSSVADSNVNSNICFTDKNRIASFYLTHWLYHRANLTTGQYDELSASFQLRNYAGNGWVYATLVSTPYGNIFTVPTITPDAEANISSVFAGVVNRQYLNSLGNSVVHKTGAETISGNKTWNTVDFYNAAHFSVYNLATESYSFGDTPSAVKYIKNNIVSSDGTLGSRRLYNDDIRILTDGQVRKNFILYPPTEEPTDKTIQIGMFGNVDGASQVFLVADNIQLAGNIRPDATANNRTCGDASHLWSEVFASTGTIQTSDKNLKTEISDIPEAVMRAWSKVKFKQFKMKNAVAEKGSNARIHMGVIANEDADSVMQAFASEGLDARRYGLFCLDEWEDQYEDEQVLVKPEVKGMVKVVEAQAMYDSVIKEDGSIEQVLVSPEKFHMEEQVIEEAVYKTEKKLVQAKGSRYSLRYDECLALTCACLQKRIEQLEARLNG